MLDRLRRADDDGIEDFLVGNFAGKLIAFLDQAVDGRALDAFRLPAELLERLVEPLDLLLGFFQMVLEPLGEVAVRRLVDQFGSALTIWVSA